jgi:hypothetical protein
LAQKFLTATEDSVADHRVALDLIASIKRLKSRPMIVRDPSLKSFVTTPEHTNNLPPLRFALKQEKKDRTVSCDVECGPFFPRVLFKKVATQTTAIGLTLVAITSTIPDSTGEHFTRIQCISKHKK